MKKLICLIISALMVASLFAALPVSAEEVKSAPTAFTLSEGLYAHGVLSSDDGEAWLLWQSETNEDGEEVNPSKKYFFLPSCADSSKVDIYNAYPYAVKLGNTEIGGGECVRFDYKTSSVYNVTAGEAKYSLAFAKSSAEAAVYVNSTKDLIPYLNENKSNNSKATGVIITPDGKIENTPVKKIKGRGNTTWLKPKKAYNINYDSKVSVAGMPTGKKYSILANYQDDSLSRNRFLYDLSDAVGMPYASDSRYVDFYSNGRYLGSYQLCEKIEVGKNTLIPDFEEDSYLDSDGKVKEDFPFVCEVDASAAEGEDYFVKLSNGIKITIKAPELEEGDTGYSEVKQYVKDKFEDFYKKSAARNADLSDCADVESLANYYLLNELGKNWDSGVSSTFFTYKQDESGVYKIYASPVWDYDNSLGNAVGVQNDLRAMKVSDYEKYTGWWCMYKGRSGNQKTSNNIVNRFAQNSNIYEIAKKLWNERYIPAIEHFTGKKFDEKIDSDFYTADHYYSLIKDSAAMNYTSGWLLNTGDWIADHSSLNAATYDKETNTYYYNKNATQYNNDFEGMYNYCRDWMISRAAWLSKEFASTKAAEVEVDNKEEPTEPSKPAETDKPAGKNLLSDLRIELPKEKYVYSGLTITPKVTIRNGDGVNVDAAFYDIKYSTGRKNVGTYTVTASLKGLTAVAMSAEFKIVPAAVKAKSLKVSKRTKTTAKLEWGKVTKQVTGYQVAYSKTKSFKTKTKKTTKKTYLTIKKLKKTKNYYFKVRAYKTVDGTKYYSKWSTAKKIATYKAFNK